MNYDHYNITYRCPHMIIHEIRNGTEAKSVYRNQRIIAGIKEGKRDKNIRIR